MKGRTILVADDDAYVRAGLRRRLTHLGYRVLEAADGLEVLRECPPGRVDAVILDHGMPNGDGRTIARVLRRESDVPIIFLSGHRQEDFRSVVTELANVYYLAKPVSDAKLTDLLRSLLGAPSTATAVV